MNPFAFFWAAQLLLLGLTVRALFLPGAWGSNYAHATWLLVVHSVLTAIWVYANLYIVKIFREARWIAAAITVDLAVWLIGVADWLLIVLYPRFHEIGFLFRYYPSRWIYWLALGAAIFEITAFLQIGTDALRRPFRQMGWNFVVSLSTGLVWRLFVIERWPHPNYYSLIWTIHLPALLVSIRLCYRCWRGNLVQTAGWQRDIDALGS